MPRDIRRSEGSGHDRLTNIADDLVQVLERHPDNPGDRLSAVILIDDPETKRGGACLHGFDDPRQAIARLLEQAMAIARSYDIPMAVAPFPAGQG